MAHSNIALKFLATLRTFFSWWGHELASFVPATWRHWYFGRGHILLVDLHGEQFALFRPGASALEKLTSIDLAPLPVDERRQIAAQTLRQYTGGRSFLVYLALPAERALRKTLRLPLAVEENLRQTLAFELDRQTPFKPEQVYFDGIVRERHPAEQQLQVELIVLPKEAVDEPVSRAAALGLPLNGAVLAGDLVEAGARCPNFLSTSPSSKRFQRRLWSNAALFLLTALLAGAAVALPIWQKRSTAIALVNLAEEARAAARQTQALRDRMETQANEYRFPVDQKNALPSTFLLVNQLTKLLPDDTWVSNLDVAGLDVQIQGETGSSSKLIELMENSGFLKEASHKSLLTQIPGTTVERFHIAAKTRPFPEQSGQKPLASAEAANTPPATPGAALPATAEPPSAAPRSATTRGIK